MTRTYWKIDWTHFKVSEVKELSSDIDIYEKFSEMASRINEIRKIVADSKAKKDLIIRCADVYNTRVEIIEEAKKECELDIKIPAKVELPEGFHIEDLDLESLPKIDIHKEQQ